MWVGVLLVRGVLVVSAEPQWSPSPATFPETPHFSLRGTGAAAHGHSFPIPDWQREATSLPSFIGMQAAQCVFEERERRERERER